MTSSKSHRFAEAIGLLVWLALGTAGVDAQETQTAPQSELYSEVPMTANEEDGLRAQLEANWNKSWAQQCPPEQQKVVEIRAHLAPDNTVTKVEPLGDLAQDSCSTQVRDSAIRAIRISSPLKIPPDKKFATVVLRFYPGDMAAEAPAPQ